MTPKKRIEIVNHITESLEMAEDISSDEKHIMLAMVGMAIARSDDYYRLSIRRSDE